MTYARFTEISDTGKTKAWSVDNFMDARMADRRGPGPVTATPESEQR